MISRYHGGAFVVFSKALNPNMTVLALEGSYASVIGGAPAAAVVFAGEVEKRTSADPRVRDVETRIADAAGPDGVAWSSSWPTCRAAVRPEKIGEVAAEFDGVHDIHRAVRVGSVDEVIPAAGSGRGSSRRSSADSRGPSPERPAAHGRGASSVEPPTIWSGRVLTNRSAPHARVVPVLTVADVRAAVEWYAEVFGFVEHVRIGEGTVPSWVCPTGRPSWWWRRSGRAVARRSVGARTR